MSFINSINLNLKGITQSLGFGAKSKATEANEESQVNNTQSSISADDVLSYMAKSAVSVVTAISSIDVSKYVDKESAERIAGFVSAFEDKVIEGLSAFNKEFEDVEISDSTKMSIVLAGLKFHQPVVM